MKLEQLNTFMAAAVSLNFTSTARRLFLSQSAVSQQMRELEDSLGVTLFERRGRGLLLSPAGATLQKLLAPILRDLKRVRAEMSSFQGVAQGVLRVGASLAPGVYLLPHAVGHFSQRYPGVQVSLAVAPTDRIMRFLHEGDLDLAVVEQEPTGARIPQGWTRQSLFPDPLVLITLPNHPWVARGTIAPGELCGQPLIMRQKASKTRQRILDQLAAAGVPLEALSVRFELDHPEAIIHAVMAGLGMGFVSRFAVATPRHAGLIGEVAIEGVRLERKLWLLRPVSSRAFQHQERFCELLHEQDWLPPELRR